MSEEIALLKEIRDALNSILYYTRPPIHPDLFPKRVPYDDKWTPIAKLKSNTQLWSVINLSSTETILITFTNNPDDNAWIPLYPEQTISRGTVPDYILAKREDGNTGEPYPVVLVELWTGEEVKTYSEREVSYLGKIGKRGR